MTVGGAAAWVLVLIVLDQPRDVHAASLAAGVLWTALTAALALHPPFVRHIGLWATAIVAALYAYAFGSALFIAPTPDALRDFALTGHAVYLFAFLVLGKRGGALASGVFLGMITLLVIAALLVGHVVLPFAETRLILAFLGMSVLDVSALYAFAQLFERDVAARSMLEALAQYALTDPLTQLPNRRALEERLEEAVARGERHGLPFALLFIDLDHFKQVNDTHGHAVGDALLQAVARRLGGAVGQADVLARISGDEFVVILGDRHPEQGARAAIERIRQALAVPETHEGLQLTIEASIGASIYPRDGTSARDLLRRADEQMYRAKGAARQARP
ncbi:GGDEF domain-containing protein [Deinococcus sonorensis]|uniref:GGDEF domain-containing protein n=2 Tax=Deinococcus sonorensis TaxID=309891 RepID=A0AAU7U5J4_9DEIO